MGVIGKSKNAEARECGNYQFQKSKDVTGLGYGWSLRNK